MALNFEPTASPAKMPAPIHASHPPPSARRAAKRHRRHDTKREHHIDRVKVAELDRQYGERVGSGRQQTSGPAVGAAAQAVHQQQRAQIAEGRDRPPHQREIVVLRQVSPDGVQRLKDGGKGEGSFARPLPHGLGGVRHDYQEIQRDVAIGVAARLAGLIAVAGRPTEGVDRGAQRIERRGEISGARHTIGHPNDEPLVGMDVLELIPVDVRQPQHRGRRQQTDQKQRDENTLPGLRYSPSAEIRFHFVSCESSAGSPSWRL